ncbi:MAG: hypothetical protein Q9160_000109 [Pyrenula sp. 1 TL-2023]
MKTFTYSTLAALYATLSAAQVAPAAITTNNPIGATYKANLLDKNTTGIRGSVTATSSSNGTGVVFQVDLFGFPDENAYVYHIHAAPLDAAGNCTKALAHLDPYQRGEAPPCDSAQPQTCQVGDLSGKHGNITTSPFQATYTDLYTSTQEGIGSFFGNRSLVVHSKNTTRLNCANFTLVPGSTGGGSPPSSPAPSGALPTGPSSNPTTGSPPPPAFTGAAATLKVASTGLTVLGCLVAFLI